ncbi:S8 family serine peptidase [Rhodanobacter glycinis]|uniref:S8 family serine peptidase n=1 Tax=Rhodanobacter glycinis TaxID=582702 RepID=A0A5B9DYC2_9GAMM|nr:S8 family serine peptidase [Rhodanobacter glycinis]QEE24164.1 S8 family serine peptidase [Rhodanobacter glycinis]
MKADVRGPGCREAALFMAIALALSACGGGGGGVKPSPAGSNPPPASTAPPPPPQPPLDAQLSLTHTYSAHSAGYTGVGVTIGVVDSGIMQSNPTVAGRVTKELIYVDPTQNNTKIDDVVGHGTWVSGIAAGTPFAQFPGGIAPGANLVSARIISDNAPDDNGSTPPSQVTVSDAQFFGSVNQDLISAGVNVMNNSWGGITWSSTDTAVTQAFHDAYSNFVLNHDGLVVFAAGNDSNANPSTIAALPSLAPDLEKGWLVVVAINSNDPTQLEGYSNKCGVAMNYCLAAPGDVIVLGKDTTATTAKPSYYIVEGTSFAAPEVSGAAALVWQAYPYFSNDLVRQTLLGTADPLGGSQPNPTFGYGELDVGKAVNGPAQFNWGDVTVDFSGVSSWNNPISGAGGLIKQGTGTLNLTQPSSYAGLTTVTGGSLNAVSLGAGGASIGTAGTLAITGTASVSVPSIAGNVANAGALVVGSSNLTVSGNYTQTGRLAVPLGSSLQVSGSASLTANAGLYVYGADQGYVMSSHTTVLTAHGGLSGTFASLSTPSTVTLKATMGYDANNAWLDVTQVNLTAIQGLPYSAASYAAAARVQSAFAAIDGQLQGTGSGGSAPVSTDFIAGAAHLQYEATTAQAARSFESLSGQLHAASAAMAFEALDAGTQALSSRFEQLLDAPQLAGHVGGWTQSLGDHGSMSRSGYGNVGFDLNGHMVGADSRLGRDGVIGYAISQSQGLGRLSESADQGSSHALEGMFYGGVIRGSWYALGRLGMGSYRENMRRQLTLGDASANVASYSNGQYGVAYGESGYRFALGGLQLTPYVNLQYAQLGLDGFDESGANGFGLMSGAQKVTRWQAGAGMRGAHQWLFANGSTLSLQARLLWQQAFAMSGEQLDASFTGLQQWLPVGGIGLSRYGGLAGVTLDWNVSPRSSLALDYQQQVAQHVAAKQATLSYRWRF